MKITNHILAVFLFCILCFFESVQASDQTNEIRIGIAGNFSQSSNSTNNQWNKYIYPAAELALREFEATNPAYKDKINFIKLDYAGRSEKVRKTVNQAVQENVYAVVGYDQSTFADIAASEFEKRKIPLITHSASADTITSGRYFAFRACFSNSSSGHSLANNAYNKLSIKHVVSLTDPTCLYCMDMNRGFNDTFSVLGGTGKTFFSNYKGEFDWKEISIIYSSIQKNGAFFVPDHEDFSAHAIKEILDRYPDAKILGGDGWGDKGDLLFNVLKGRSFHGYKIAHWSIDVKSKKSKQFTKNFTERYGVEPVESAALMYDAVFATLLAATRAENAQGTAAALSEIKFFDGVTGIIDFSKRGQGKAPIFQMVNQGHFVTVQ